MNYMAEGEGKVWYGVPGSQAEQFELKMLSKLNPNVVKSNPKIIYSITAMIPPDELIDNNVQVCRLVQEPGTFIITFPAAYHAGFSCGWNVAEAVNMALPDWLPYGRKSILRYENQDGIRSGRPPCFSHEMLLVTLIRRALDDVEVERKQMEDNYLKLLMREFSPFVRQEISRREQIFSKSIVRGISPHNNERSTYKRECKKCKTFSWFSAVTCEDCPETGRKTKFSCLVHAETHCAKHSNLVIYEWVTLETLTKLLERMNERLSRS